MITPYREHFEHDADMGVRGFASIWGQSKTLNMVFTLTPIFLKFTEAELISLFQYRPCPLHADH